ncbi:MAG: MFS transporter [Actinomycetia bacterium]|nr:MFS transporter [Actinomycetes bacterium]
MTNPTLPADPGFDDESVARSAWLALAVTTLVFFLVVVDISAVNVGFPSIADDFDVSTARLSWILSGYNVTVAALLLTAGRLADSLGRKKVFLPGVVIFMIGSILCGLAPGVNALIAARVLQAVGGAILSPTALAVVLPEFPPAKRSTAIGLLGATGGLGAVAGPAIGSILIDLGSWRGIFLINVPVCLLVLVVAPRLLRESKNPAARGRIDLIGVVIGTSAIGAIMIAIVQSGSWGPTDTRVVALALVGLGLIPILIRRSRHHEEPLIEIPLFRHRTFNSANAAVALFSLAFTSGFLTNSLLLQEVWDQSITTTGKALVLSPLISAVTSPLAGRLADRIGHRWILTVGSLSSATGYVGYLLLLNEEPHVFDRLVPLSLLVGIGTGLTIATWSSAGLSDIAPDQFGTANATMRTTQQVFYALGISVVVALLAAGTGATDGIGGYRWAWVWVATMYSAAAVAIAITFPSGSSRQRAAEAALLSGR